VLHAGLLWMLHDGLVKVNLKPNVHKFALSSFRSPWIARDQTLLPQVSHKGGSGGNFWSPSKDKAALYAAPAAQDGRPSKFWFNAHLEQRMSAQSVTLVEVPLTSNFWSLKWRNLVSEALSQSINFGTHPSKDKAAL